MVCQQRMGTALITGASSGIGAAYAESLAQLGYDLILVARNRSKLNKLANMISNQTQRAVEVFVADLTDKQSLATVEDKVRQDASITLLVNNASIVAHAPLLDSQVDRLERMIDLNVIALMRLTYAVVPSFIARGSGAIINISSISSIGPESFNGVYGGSKAFVQAFSLSLHHELACKGIQIQVVLTGVVTREYWEINGLPPGILPKEIVMSEQDLVSAALVGFAQKELVTIPSLHQVQFWEEYEIARQNIIQNISNDEPALRYL